MRKAYDSYTGAWARLREKRYWADRGAWVDIIEESDTQGVSPVSAFGTDSYLGRGTILQRDVSTMPIHEHTEDMARFMWDWRVWTPGGAFGSGTSVNTASFGTQPVHMYVVDSSAAHIGRTSFDLTITGATGGLDSEWQVYKDLIPSAPFIVPAQNGDRGLAIYDVHTGLMLESFGTTRRADGTYQGTGGYSIARPGLQHLAEDNYSLRQQVGIATVSGMHNSLGFIGIEELIRGEINHAVCFTTSAFWTRHPSYPARASDGKGERYHPDSTYPVKGSKSYTGPRWTPTHGQWCVLPEDVDPDYNPRTGRPYNPLTQVIIRAFKKYGGLATDTNLWCHAFNIEQSRTFQYYYGVDPTAYGGILQRMYKVGDTPGFDVSDFPWDRTIWAADDWGRPARDFEVPYSGWYQPGYSTEDIDFSPHHIP